MFASPQKEGGTGIGTGIRPRYMWVDTSTSIGSPQSPLIACHEARPESALFRRLTGDWRLASKDPLPLPHRLPGQR